MKILRRAEKTRKLPRPSSRVLVNSSRKGMRQTTLVNLITHWTRIQYLTLLILIMPKPINLRLRRARKLRSYWLEWMKKLIPRRSVLTNIINQTNLQMKMRKIAHEGNPKVNAPSAGNGIPHLRRVQSER
jgi:hypothetical protein